MSAESLPGAPDSLRPGVIESGLDTRWLARQYHFLESTDSTNREAFALGRAGAPHGATVVAEAQTAGRGRLGRGFFSPARRNLYASVLLRPQLAVADAPTVVLATAVAVAECVAESVSRPDAVTIKWPNDVLLAGRKTCGILTELEARGSRVHFLVLGVGVNLNVQRHEFPPELREVATSLAAFEGAEVDRARFARRLFGTLEPILDRFAVGGFEALRPRFEARCDMLGRWVEISDAEGRADQAGVATGIDPDGALRLRRHDGALVRVMAGDVTVAKTGGAS